MSSFAIVAQWLECFLHQRRSVSEEWWNIRNVKLKFYFFPEMRLYFLLFTTAVCFFDSQNWNKNSYLLSRLSAAGFWPMSSKGKEMKHGMKMIWTAKIRKLNEEMTPHWLILSCLPRMHVSFVYVPSPLSPFPSPTHKERTGWRWKAGLQFDPVPYLAAQQPRALRCHIFTA